MMWQSWACWLGWWTAFLNIFIVLEQLARSPETAETLLPPCLWCCCFFLCVYVCVSHKYADSLRPSPSLSITHKQAGYATFWKHTHTCRHINADEQVHAYLLTCTGTPTHTHARAYIQTNEPTNVEMHTPTQAHTLVYKQTLHSRAYLSSYRWLVWSTWVREWRGWGKSPSNEMNMYQMEFEVVTCIQPCILTERLSLCHHQDIIRCLNDTQNPGDFHI